MLQALLVAVASTLGAGTGAPPVDTLVVCPDEFRPALARWVDYRAAQGRQIAIVSSSGSCEQIRAAMHARVGRKPPRYIVLAGDVSDAGAGSSAPARGGRRGATARGVPTRYVEAKVNVRWKSEPEIPSDNWYADWDGDQIPDAAIGRLPADSPAELASIVERIVRYETAADPGAWRRRVNFVAGVGGFGAWVDGILEAGAKRLVSDNLPAEYATSLTFASWQSPYCPDPRRFCDVTLDRFNEGCLFWVYIGHGHRRWVDVLRAPDRRPYRILTYQEVDRLQAGDCPPIACFFACYTAAFDGREDCLGEEMLRRPGGPVAVIGGSRVTMPYGMAIFGRELLHACFDEQAETLGDAVLAAKRRTMEPAPSDASARILLDSLATLASPPPADLAAERTEHLHLMNLLGDPLLHIQRPQPVAVATSAAAATDRGGTLTVHVAAPIAGRCSIELVARRDRPPVDPPHRDRYNDSDAELTKFDAVYAAANNLCWRRCEAELSAPGVLDAELEIPADAAGPCHVRVFIAGERECAAGACDVLLPLAATGPPAAR